MKLLKRTVVLLLDILAWVMVAPILLVVVLLAAVDQNRYVGARGLGEWRY